MLTKEGIAQSLAVLGAPSSIACRDPSVLVWTLGVRDKIEFILWDLVRREFIFCCNSVQCCQP